MRRLIRRLNGDAQFTVADTNLVLPPSWAFGVLYGGYTNQQETIERVKEIKKHDYPIDAYWIDSWFWSYADKGIGPKKFIDFVADTSSLSQSQSDVEFPATKRNKRRFLDMGLY